MANTFTCACGRKYEITQIRASGLRVHRGRRQYRRFEQSVIAPWTPQAPESPAPVPTSTALEPGTEREITHSRPEEPIDIATAGLKALGCGVATSLILSLGTVIKWPWLAWLGCPWPWYVPLYALLPSSGAWWFVATQNPQQWVMFAEKVIRKDLNRDGMIGERSPYQVEGKFEAGEHRTIYTRFGVSDPAAFHRFCKAVSAGECNFSGRAAGDFGLDGEWKGILEEFKDRGLAQWDGKARTTPKLTRWGEQAVKTFASTPPPVGI